jgi:hypothetical protein
MVCRQIDKCYLISQGLKPEGIKSGTSSEIKNFNTGVRKVSLDNFFVLIPSSSELPGRSLVFSTPEE